MLFAVVKRYEKNGQLLDAWLYKANAHHEIYEKMMELTDNDHEISENAAAWCISASVADTYEFREGEIMMTWIN